MPAQFSFVDVRSTGPIMTSCIDFTQLNSIHFGFVFKFNLFYPNTHSFIKCTAIVAFIHIFFSTSLLVLPLSLSLSL